MALTSSQVPALLRQLNTIARQHYKHAAALERKAVIRRVHPAIAPVPPEEADFELAAMDSFRLFMSSFWSFCLPIQQKLAKNLTEMDFSKQIVILGQPSDFQLQRTSHEQSQSIYYPQMD
jgi:hypothetical protein